MTIVVFGIYCKEDKSGRFFQVKSKSKADLWPFIKKYVDPNTSIICTDSAKQYFGVEKLLKPGAVQLSTNHSKGEYVSKTDKNNTINDLEYQNRLLKKAMVCRKSIKLVEQYMALHYYRTNHLENDVKKVYPGNGFILDIAVCFSLLYFLLGY